MNCRFVIPCLVSLVISTASLAIAGPTVSPELARQLERIRKQTDVPALAAAAAGPNDDVAYAVVGIRALPTSPKVKPDDLFHVGSLTKAMTATMIAVLVEKGTMRWDQTIGETFDDLDESVLDEYRDVTLEELLNHRSGLPDDRRDMALVMDLRQLPGPNTAKRQAALAVLLSRPVGDDHGRGMLYANANYIVAAAMAEKATGKSWEELMQELVFEPLGMTSVGFGAPGVSDPPKQISQPRGHTSTGKKLTAVQPSVLADNPPVSAPAGGVHCSIADLAVFVQEHLKGHNGQGVLLPKSAYQFLHEDSKQVEYALGWGVLKDTETNRDMLQHAGSNSMWFAIMHVDFTESTVAVAATNAASMEAQNACRQAIDKAIKLQLARNAE